MINALNDDQKGRPGGVAGHAPRPKATSKISQITPPTGPGDANARAMPRDTDAMANPRVDDPAEAIVATPEREVVAEGVLAVADPLRGASSLEDLEREIREECSALAGLLKDALDRKLRLGRLLAEAQAACRAASRSWRGFVASLGLNERTAREAMQFYKNQDAIEPLRHGGAAPTVGQVRLALSASRKPDPRAADGPIAEETGDQTRKPRTHAVTSGSRVAGPPIAAVDPARRATDLHEIVEAVGDDVATSSLPAQSADGAGSDSLDRDDELPLAGFTAAECIEMLAENEELASRLISLLASGLDAVHLERMRAGIRRAYAALESLEHALAGVTMPAIVERPSSSP